MIIDFTSLQKFDNIEVFLFLGFPKGYTNNKTFLVQFKGCFKEIEGEFNIDIWRTISAGNVIYKDIIDSTLKIKSCTKNDIDNALKYLLREGLITKIGKVYSDVFENIKNYTLIRQGYRYDFDYDGENFAIRLEGDDKELDSHQRLVWKLADGKSTAEEIISHINTQIKKEYKNHNTEVSTIKLAVAIIFCVKNRYIYLI